MKTLNEKYHGVVEGAYTKAQFLRDARLQLPGLVTQYNGFDDAVKILKNRGLIFELSMQDEDDMYEADLEVGADEYEDQEETRVQANEMEDDLRSLGEKLKSFEFGYMYQDDHKYWAKGSEQKTKLEKDINDFIEKYPGNEKLVIGLINKIQSKTWKYPVFAPQEFRALYPFISRNRDLEYFGWDRPEEVDEAGQIVPVLETKEETPVKSPEKLPLIHDFSIEAVERGLDVELEKMGYNTVSHDFDDKVKRRALRKVVNNLKKDRTYYYKQLAQDSGAECADKMEPVTKKNHVDTANGMKKAHLKEAIKGLIKTILEDDQKQPLKEGAERLERLLNMVDASIEEENPDLKEGIQDLIDIVLEMEKAVFGHRSKIEQAYKKMGPFLSRSISEAFQKEILDVVHRVRLIPLPKTRTISPEELNALN